MKKFIVTLVHPETKKVYKTKITYTDEYANMLTDEDLLSVIRATAGFNVNESGEPIRCEIISFLINNYYI